ncbi:MAG: addiction module protein [bacterium]|nr:addiction module protein [bacterium]
MSKTLKELEEDALSLPIPERAQLIERLLPTLNIGQDEDVEENWLAEAERRYQEYRSGKVNGKPADQVFENAYGSLK